MANTYIEAGIYSAFVCINCTLGKLVTSLFRRILTNKWMNNKIRILSFCCPQQSNESEPWSSMDANFSRRDVQILLYKSTHHLLWCDLARKIKSLQASITKHHFGLKQETRGTRYMHDLAGHHQQNPDCGELNRQNTGFPPCRRWERERERETAAMD